MGTGSQSKTPPPFGMDQTLVPGPMRHRDSTQRFQCKLAGASTQARHDVAVQNTHPQNGQTPQHQTPILLEIPFKEVYSSWSYLSKQGPLGQRSSTPCRLTESPGASDAWEYGTEGLGFRATTFKKQESLLPKAVSV